MSKTTKALAILGVVAGLGVAAMPLSSYAATSSASDQVTVKLEVEDFISCDVTTANKTVDLGKVKNNALAEAGNATVNIKTNNANGYRVSISAPTTGDHIGQTEMIGVTPANKIAAGNPEAAGITKSAWGYKASSEATNVTMEPAAANYAGVSETTVQIATGAEKTANAGDDITLTFNAFISADQNADVYTGYAEVTAVTGQA